jgi:hypothetical protein
MSSKFKGVHVLYFKSVSRLKVPTARMQRTLTMFLRHCTLSLARSAKFPQGWNKLVSSHETIYKYVEQIGDRVQNHESKIARCWKFTSPGALSMLSI